MLYAIKKQNESNERLISRFKKVVQRSRVVMNAKKSRYHMEKPKKRHIREAAVKREFYRKKRAKEKYYSS